MLSSLSFCECDVYALCVINTISGLVGTSMFALAPFIVLSSGATDDPKGVGFWSGIMISAFFVGRVLVARYWVWAASCVDRSKLLQASLLGTCMTTLCCAFVSEVRSIVLLRFATGCLSAVQTICHAMAGELGKDRGIAFHEFGWTLASMLGPALSGYSWHLRVHVASRALPKHAAVCIALAALQLLALLLTPRQPLKVPAESPQFEPYYGSTISSPSLLRNASGRLRIALALNAAHVFVSSAMDEMTVLLGVDSLSFNAERIAIVLFLAGMTDFILQNKIIVWLLSHVEPEQLQLIALALWAPSMLAPPALSADLSPRTCLYGLASSVAWRKTSSFLFNFANTSLLSSYASDDRALALAHDWRVTTTTLMQIGGGLVGSIAYASLATSRLDLPYGNGFVFACAALFGVALIAGSKSLPMHQQNHNAQT